MYATHFASDVRAGSFSLWLGVFVKLRGPPAVTVKLPGVITGGFVLFADQRTSVPLRSSNFCADAFRGATTANVPSPLSS